MELDMQDVVLNAMQRTLDFRMDKAEAWENLHKR